MPRQYGDGQNIREACYEALFQRGGQPMHVNELARIVARLLNREDGASARRLPVTMASKMNMEISAEGGNSRFVRPAPGEFGLARFDPDTYEGGFRKVLADEKQDRREQSAAAGEGKNPLSASAPRPLREVKLPRMPPPHTGKLTPAQEATIRQIETFLERNVSFTARLRASAALRTGDIEAANSFLDRIDDVCNDVVVRGRNWEN